MKGPELKSAPLSPNQKRARAKLLKDYHLPNTATNTELAGHLDIRDAESPTTEEFHAFVDSDGKHEYGIPDEPEYPKASMVFRGFVRDQGINFGEFNLDGHIIRLRRREIDRCVRRFIRIHDYREGLSKEEKGILKRVIVMLKKIAYAWPKGELGKEDATVKKLVESGKSIYTPSDKEFRELMEAMETEQSINERVNPESNNFGSEEKGGENEDYEEV